MSEKVVIKYDSREPEEYIDKLKLMLPELEFERCTLPVGDYIIRGVVIERKSASDYLQSLISKDRLNNQLVNLSYNFELSYLVIIGFPYITAEAMKIPRKTVTSSILGCSFKRYAAENGKNGVVVTIQVESDRDFADLLMSLSTKEKIRVPKLSRIRLTPSEQMVATLATIPGWGTDTAKYALKVFGTIEAVFNATPEELEKKVFLCGPKKAQAIQKHLKEKYTE